MSKGADYEREICKRLSRWWTYDSRDDVFWRSSQSGGRATVRFRKGQTTAGSYGDICALDPIGEPLLKVFTVELKRGEYVKHPGDLLDCSGSEDCHPFLGAIKQAREAHERAGSRSWLLIVKRDRKHSTIFFPARLLISGEPLHEFQPALIAEPVFRYRISGEDFVGMKLDKFLSTVDPATIAATTE